MSVMNKFFKIPKRKVKEFTWESPCGNHKIVPTKTAHSHYIIHKRVLEIDCLPDEFKDKLEALNGQDIYNKYEPKTGIKHRIEGFLK